MLPGSLDLGFGTNKLLSTRSQSAGKANAYVGSAGTTSNVGFESELQKVLASAAPTPLAPGFRRPLLVNAP